MERDRQDALQWFVEFANMDLGQLKAGDKAKLLVESEEYLSPAKDIQQFQERLELAKDRGAWEDLKKTEEFWPYILRLQDMVKRTLDSIISFSSPPPKPFKHVRELVWSGNLYCALSCKSETFHFHLLPVTITDQDYIQVKLYQLLDGFPISTVQRCPGCTRYYLNFAKRRKRFCSPRCMWRISAEKKRRELKEQHPGQYKAYLKKQRETMRKKYEEKQWAKGYKKVTRYKRKEG